MVLKSNDEIHFYELVLNVTGLSANCLLRAYIVVDGEKVFQPEFDKTILAGDVTQADAHVQTASYRIMEALQEYINNNLF